MGLDVGERTIGVALTDPDRRIASPLTTVRRTNLKSDLEALGAIITREEVVEIVVGMPRSLSGDFNFQAEKTQRFIEQLQRTAAAPVKTWDERFSTTEADRTLRAGGANRAKRQQLVDQTAAAIILQSYLSWQSNGGRGQRGDE